MLTNISLRNLFLSKVAFHPEIDCWIWCGYRNKSGYGFFDAKNWCGINNIGAHRFSYMLFIDDIPDGMDVCHKCDIPQCVNPKHLFLGTPRDNVLDAVAKGRWVVAGRPKRGRCKLTKENVKLIRATLPRWNLGVAMKLCADLSVSLEAIRDVFYKRTWADV